jgi:hypothetical protein
VTGRIATVIGMLMVHVVTTSSAADAACAEDVADLERVLLTLTMPTDLRREAEGLMDQAKALCESGDDAAASSKSDEAWQQIVSSDEVAGPTVAELATGSCQDGVALVQGQVEDESRVSEMGRTMAQRLIKDAEQLCREDERIMAEEKLSLAMAILTEE